MLLFLEQVADRTNKIRHSSWGVVQGDLPEIDTQYATAGEKG